MRVYIFKGREDHLYGFTPEQSGNNLPVEKGPWRLFKSIEIIEENPAPRIGVNETDILTGIRSDEYYLKDLTEELFE
jgi:hypothetical protein